MYRYQMGLTSLVMLLFLMLGTGCYMNSGDVCEECSDDTYAEDPQSETEPETEPEPEVEPEIEITADMFELRLSMLSTKYYTRGIYTRFVIRINKKGLMTTLPAQEVMPYWKKVTESLRAEIQMTDDFGDFTETFSSTGHCSSVDRCYFEYIFTWSSLTTAGIMQNPKLIVSVDSDFHDEAVFAMKTISLANNSTLPDQNLHPVTSTGKVDCMNFSTEWVFDIGCAENYVTGSVDSPFGQDAHYNIHPDADFSDNGDGTVKDNLTGDIWLKCALNSADVDTSDGGTPLQDPSCNGTVGAFVFSSDIDSYSNARDACENLTYAGISDWQLPAENQLTRLVAHHFTNPTTYTVFSKNPPGSFWSSTGGQVNLKQPYVNSVSPNISGYNHVRCISPAVKPVITDSVFEFLPDGLVKDRYTGLIWNRCNVFRDYNPDSEYLCTGEHLEVNSFQEAMAVCETRNTGGYTGWRVPDYNEMMSLNPIRHIPVFVDFAYYDTFPSISNNTVSPFWKKTTLITSTPVVDRPGIVWTFQNGKMDPFGEGLSTPDYYVMCVTGPD